MKKFVRACNEISYRHSLSTVELTDAELETIYAGGSLLGNLLGGATSGGTASGDTASGAPDVSVGPLHTGKLIGTLNSLLGL